MVLRARSAVLGPRQSFPPRSLGSSAFGEFFLSSGVSPLSNARSTPLRLVPPQTPENVDPLVISYIESEFAKLNSKNTLTIENLHGGKPWVTDHTHWNFEAAKKATKVRFCFFALRCSLMGMKPRRRCMAKTQI